MTKTRTHPRVFLARVASFTCLYNACCHQVDVRALKETLWHQARATQAPGPLPFSELLATIPETNPAGPLPELSVHLCFICLLHLANEHGLAIHTSDGLDELTVCNVQQ